VKSEKMKESILKQKTYEFAVKVINVYKQIVAQHKEFVLSKQFLKAGTAPGALVREAEYGQSKPDFISKLSIALKEANECDYWTCLLKDSEYISQATFDDLQADNKEIIYMLVSSVKTAKSNLIMKSEEGKGKREE
jgi:four helix bundle protein